MTDKTELLNALKTALRVIDDITQDTLTEDSPYLEEFAEIHNAIDNAIDSAEG